jgi:hypothetical protein
MAVPISNLSSTWTGSSGNTAIGMHVTDEGNSPNSNLMVFTVNTELKYRVDSNGNVYANNYVVDGRSIKNNFVVAWILS